MKFLKLRASNRCNYYILPGDEFHLIFNAADGTQHLLLKDQIEREMHVTEVQTLDVELPDGRKGLAGVLVEGY